MIDGTGAPGRVADVAIEGDRIVKVGKLDAPARKVIDAKGKIVTPGFTENYYPLRRPDPLGSGADVVVRAWFHHCDRRQLRADYGAGAARQRGMALRPHGRGRIDSARRDRRRDRADSTKRC